MGKHRFNSSGRQVGQAFICSMIDLYLGAGSKLGSWVILSKIPHEPYLALRGDTNEKFINNAGSAVVLSVFRKSNHSL